LTEHHNFSLSYVANLLGPPFGWRAFRSYFFFTEADVAFFIEKGFVFSDADAPPPCTGLVHRVLRSFQGVRKVFSFFYIARGPAPPTSTPFDFGKLLFKLRSYVFPRCAGPLAPHSLPCPDSKPFSLLNFLPQYGISSPFNTFFFFSPPPPREARFRPRQCRFPPPASVTKFFFACTFFFCTFRPDTSDPFFPCRRTRPVCRPGKRPFPSPFRGLVSSGLGRFFLSSA